MAKVETVLVYGCGPLLLLLLLVDAAGVVAEAGTARTESYVNRDGCADERMGWAGAGEEDGSCW